MTIPLLKLYGERNTGTSYLSKIIEKNLRVKLMPGTLPEIILKKTRKLKRILSEERMEEIYFYLMFHQNLGWKHMLVRNADDLCKYAICARNLSFVTLTKNPYSWLLSLHRNPYHHYHSRKQDFETFLTSAWRTLGHENIPGVIKNPVELWNIKNSSYLQLKNHFPTLNLKYETVVNEPGQVLEMISKNFSYTWKISRFENHERSTKEKNKDFAFYRDYYLNERWKEKLSSRSILIINDHVDDNLMKYFNYQKLA